MKRDGPVEWTGEAHLVTVSCSECDESVKVPECRAAEQARGLHPITCEECEHECIEGDHLAEQPNDSALPPHIVPFRCETCGQRYHFDVVEGTHELAE